MEIIINTNQLRLLKEHREITFEEFFINLKTFLKGLLENPYSAQVPEFFKTLGYSKEKLIGKMKKLGMLKSEEDIIEVPVTEAKLRAKHTIVYKIPKQFFMDRAHELKKEICDEATILPSVFDDEETQIEAILNNDIDGAYHNRGGVGRNF